MADIRINSLSTTAASTASDDFVAVDGSANGTRKLNAYSPTFGGNLTVSGTSTLTGNAGIGISPSSIWASAKALQINSGLTLMGDQANGYISGNSYYNGTNWIYNTTNKAVRLDLENGVATFLVAGTGTAGNAITYTSALSINNAGSATLAGNLTVSGTGTSSVGGLFDANAGLRAVSAPSYAASTGKGVEMLYISTSDIGYVQSYDRTASAYKLLNLEGSTLRLNSGSGGNVLVGTTVNSTGLLQIGTNTSTSAGGIGFGTDTPLFRTGAGQLQIGTGSGNSVLEFNGAASGAEVITFYQAGTTVGQIGFISNTSLVLRTGVGPTTALTLDSSQNATFAGLLKTSGGDVRIGSTYAYTWFKDATPTKAWGIGTNGWAGLTGGDGSMIFGVYNSPTWTKALEIDQSTNATFAGTVNSTSTYGWTIGAQSGKARVQHSSGTFSFVNTSDGDGNIAVGTIAASGAISIGNTVNTVSPTSPNRTVTIVIGGTTYYIPAKTTND